MKKRYQAALGAYTRHIADEMGLRDWHLEVVISSDLPDGGLDASDEFSAVASCTPTPGQKKARITYVPNFNKFSPEFVREIVTHELLHCHLAAMYEWGRTGLHGVLGQSEYNVFMFGFAQQWETAIDGISRAWATHMPLISWKHETAL